MPGVDENDIHKILNKVSSGSANLDADKRQPPPHQKLSTGSTPVEDASPSTTTESPVSMGRAFLRAVPILGELWVGSSKHSRGRSAVETLGAVHDRPPPASSILRRQRVVRASCLLRNVGRFTGARTCYHCAYPSEECRSSRDH